MATSNPIPVTPGLGLDRVRTDTRKDEVRQERRDLVRQAEAFLNEYVHFLQDKKANQSAQDRQALFGRMLQKYSAAGREIPSRQDFLKALAQSSKVPEALKPELQQIIKKTVSETPKIPDNRTRVASQQQAGNGNADANAQGRNNPSTQNPKALQNLVGGYQARTAQAQGKQAPPVKQPDPQASKRPVLPQKGAPAEETPQVVGQAVLAGNVKKGKQETRTATTVSETTEPAKAEEEGLLAKLTKDVKLILRTNARENGDLQSKMVATLAWARNVLSPSYEKKGPAETKLAKKEEGKNSGSVAENKTFRPGQLRGSYDPGSFVA
jgi:hypothetical protein